MNTVGLNAVGHMYEVLVDHGNKGRVMAGGEFAKDGLEGLNVIGAIVRRKGDSSQEDFDMGVLEAGEDRIEIAPRLVKGKAAQPIIATEFHQHDLGMQLQNGGQLGDRVLGGGTAGSLIVDFVFVAAAVQFPLQRVGISLTRLQSIAGRNAVAEADEKWPAVGVRRHLEYQHPKRNDQEPANVHMNSVKAETGSAGRDETGGPGIA
jgi:hypothetical protein